MQMAQMPTFADKFLAGLRGGEDSAYKHQMGLSQLEMNMAYKQAQAQQMREASQLHQAQLRNQVSKYISDNLVGDNRPEMVSYAQSAGMPESMVPARKFEETTYQTQQPIEDQMEGRGLPEGYDATSTQDVTTKTPIKFSDWGTDAAFKQKALDQKMEIAQLTLQQKNLIEQAKRERPQDPLGKLTESFLAGRITPEDFYAMKNKMMFITDPARATTAASGWLVPGNMNGSGSTPNQVRSQLGLQAPVAGPMGPQATEEPLTPSHSPTYPGNLPSGTPAQKSKGTPGIPGKPMPINATPLPKKIEETAKESEATQAVISSLNTFENKIDEIIGKTPQEKAAFSSALSPLGVLTTRIPKTDTYGVAAKIESLKSKLMIEVMGALKAASQTGATGFGQLSEREGEVLRTSIENLNMNMSEKDFSHALAGVRNEINRLRGLATQKLSNISSARNVQMQGSGNAAPEGTRVQVGDTFQVKRNGKWEAE
jgi:hypothetical protein